jgi:hypothetical protein
MVHLAKKFWCIETNLPKYTAKEIETQGNFAPALDNGEK